MLDRARRWKSIAAFLLYNTFSIAKKHPRGCFF